ncbi:hypothetical protein QW180_23845 [Vibrio sinaloensis]|nr:hypothetical protein [Vibrio sinaloensis]
MQLSIQPIQRAAIFAVQPNRELPDDVFDWIQSLQQGQRLLGESYYTFSQISAPNNGSWTVVSVFPVERFNLSRQAFNQQYSWFLPASVCRHYAGDVSLQSLSGSSSISASTARLRTALSSYSRKTFNWLLSALINEG